jgi:hypothetical protein
MGSACNPRFNCHTSLEQHLQAAPIIGCFETAQEKHIYRQAEFDI